MIPKNFKQENGNLARPEDMTDEQCSSLPIHRYTQSDGFPAILSFWSMTEDEIESVRQQGGIWCSTVGHTLAPFLLFAYNPFAQGSIAPIADDIVDLGAQMLKGETPVVPRMISKKEAEHLIFCLQHFMQMHNDQPRYDYFKEQIDSRIEHAN